MLNSYKQLTGRYLKASKKRTILTIVGIVLSVALICTIGLFFKALQSAEIESVKNSKGSFHILFEKPTDSFVSKITNNPQVSRCGMYNIGETIDISEKLQVMEIKGTSKALELLPCKVKEGRFPESEKEAAIEKWVLRKINDRAKVGDKISINNKEYILSGVLEDNVETQMEGAGRIICKTNNLDSRKSTLLVEISSKANLKKALDEVEQLGKKEDIKSIRNSHLLAMQGVGDKGSGVKGLFMVVGVVIAIVVISTIAVIYNSFQISVVERIKQFGLLRAVGTTPKQIRKIVLREATILGAIGVPIGLLLSVAAIYAIKVVFKLVGGDTIFPMKVEISPIIMGISAVVGIISIYLSALIPAFFAGRISPLVAISSRNSISKEKIKKRKNRIVTKVFGFEGAMASKNIKRNRKRYRITVFSIVISVVLFVTFKSFMDAILMLNGITNETSDVTFLVTPDPLKEIANFKIEDKIIEDIKALNTIDKVYKFYNIANFMTAIDKKSEVKEVKKIKDIYKDVIYNGDKKTLIEGGIDIYEDNAMEAAKKYVEAGSIDIEKLNKENGVILINKSVLNNGKKNYYGQAANLKIGDEIYIQADKSVEFGKGTVKKAKIMAIVKYDPFDFRSFVPGIKVISTKEVYKNLTGINNVNPTYLNMIIKNSKDEENTKNAIEDIIRFNTSLKLINNMDYSRNTKTGLLMVQILVYGFVIVVALIGSVNIFNTITTNIILRKREFAALKSIGLTQKGLKKMIVLEGLLYGVMGTIYGAIIASGLSYLIYKGFIGVADSAWAIPWKAIVTAGIAALSISYISVLSPLGRIKKDNLIEAIREDY